MKRSRVLLLAFAIIILGGYQVWRWYGQPERAASMGTASGMIAILSGVAMGLFGLSIREKK